MSKEVLSLGLSSRANRAVLAWVKRFGALTALSLTAIALSAQSSVLHAGNAHSATISAKSVELDHVVAVVDDDAILQSDVDNEIRFTALQSGALPPSQDTQVAALNRLIDRALIDTERKLQPSFSAVTPQQVDDSIAELKKDIPACANGACSTAEGWKDFLHSEGFTVEEVHDRMQERLQIIKFIDWRFGSTVRITQNDIRTYYQQVLQPEFAHEKKTAPPVAQLSSRIREILLQQRVTGLLDDWLKSLRSQDQVDIIDPKYASVGGAS